MSSPVYSCPGTALNSRMGLEFFDSINAPSPPTQLGYNMLFVDADILIYKPLVDYFFTPEMLPYDTAWQVDGAVAPRFAPFFANRLGGEVGRKV